MNGDEVLSEVQTEDKIVEKNELYKQYNWFYQSFLPSTQLACDEFFLESFDFKLISVSKNINILFQGDDYFVTKVRIDKQHDAFFRCSQDAVKIILDKTLGKTKNFNLSNISELEAKIISSFNDYLYSRLSNFLLPPPPKTQKRKNFDMIHLTFFIKEKNSNDSAKFIISLPQILLNPEIIESSGEKFNLENFRASKINVIIKIGTTKFHLKELKNLEKEDIVIFEDSNINLMKLIYKDYEKDFKINPNLGLITPIDNDNGGDNMEKNSLSPNLWDDIQVEMGAEFEKVKITLGELKDIEEGLVLDLSSVYNNKISLKVENKTIAKGELVIINDRYGVRIDEVFASEKNQAGIQQVSDEVDNDTHFNNEHEEVTQENESTDEEFDYSDFELDNEDI